MAKIDKPRKGYYVSGFVGIVSVKESHYDRLGNLWAVCWHDNGPTMRKGDFVNCGLPTSGTFNFYPCAEYRKFSRNGKIGVERKHG